MYSRGPELEKPISPYKFKRFLFPQHLIETLWIGKISKALNDSPVPLAPLVEILSLCSRTFARHLCGPVLTDINADETINAACQTPVEEVNSILQHQVAIPNIHYSWHMLPNGFGVALSVLEQLLYFNSFFLCICLRTMLTKVVLYKTHQSVFVVWSKDVRLKKRINWYSTSIQFLL